MASDAPEGEGSNTAVFDCDFRPVFNLQLQVNDSPTAESLSNTVADAASFGVRAAGIGIGAAGIGIGAAGIGIGAAGVGIGVAAARAGKGIGKFFSKHPELVRRSVQKAFEVTGREVASVKPKCILVELHCYTEESFRSFMEDFKAGKVQERLNKEFENSGYIGEELEVTITNYEEACKFLEQISRYAVALHLLSRYNRTCVY